jgi:hypothetical protein
VKDHKTKTTIRRVIKTVSWILAGIVGLIILAVAALQFHGVQRYIMQKALSSISEKTHTRIEVGTVTIAFTHSVVLQNIFIEGQQRDTLLSIQSLAIDVNLFSLLSPPTLPAHCRTAASILILSYMHSAPIQPLLIIITIHLQDHIGKYDWVD